MPEPTPVSTPNGRPDPKSPFTDPLLPATPIPLPELCKRINEKISAFLAQDAETEALRSVQKHTRIALGVIEEALKKYRYICTSIAFHDRIMLIITAERTASSS
jgi:FAD synthetase